jgi:hypothetical protein
MASFPLRGSASQRVTRIALSPEAGWTSRQTILLSKPRRFAAARFSHAGIASTPSTSWTTRVPKPVRDRTAFSTVQIEGHISDTTWRQQLALDRELVQQAPSA